MKKTTAALVCFFVLGYASAQHNSITGIVSDTAANTTLTNAVVSALRAKDSVLLRFTRSDSKGRFTLSKIPAGNIIILITCPRYADYVEPITITDSTSSNLQTVPLILKSSLLAEVVVKQKIAAIKIKGDTTEFLADSFHMQANATVEELLKKLPGIQVDKNGKITAQGETVQKVLVDGEEFFGDDPTLVTQNLRADMIDKVQVFDKKSDQANFTGIDDGQKQKTINLTLKNNKKNGYFGRANLGGGTNGYFDNQLVFNYFKKKQKISAYGILSNTGKTGLNWSDRDKYGESMASSVDFDETNGWFFFSGNEDELSNWDGRYNGRGYPKVQTAGIHYNDKWNSDKESVNLNYKTMRLDVEGNNATNSQFILPDTLYYNNQNEKFRNQIIRHRANGNYEVQLDSSTSIKISADGGTDHKQSQSVFQTEARAADSTLVNTGDRQTSTNGEMRMVNSNLLLKKKFHKKGRTFSWNLNEKYEHDGSDGFLFASNTFYKGSIPYLTQVTDQYKKYLTEKLALSSKISYSEPLSPSAAIIASYGFYVNNSRSNRESFNKSADGKYDARDSVFSNDYRFNVLTHQISIGYNLIKKKYRVNVNNGIGITSFRQDDLIADTSTNRHFINYFPQAQFSWMFNSQTRASISYNGSTEQPTIQQIQPIRSNDDPLNITIGNPALHPEFTHSFRLNFNQYKVLTESGVYTGINFRIVQNGIGNSTTVDSGGKRTYQAVNLNGQNSLSGYTGYGFKLKKAGLYVDLSLDLNYNNTVSIVNAVLNHTSSGTYAFNLNLNKSKEKKYEFRLGLSPAFTSSRSTIQNSLQTKYWTFQIQPSADVFLPLKFQVHTDVDANLRQRTSAFDFNTNVVLWNAWVGKKFFKKESLLLKAAANDILNQNIGFNRQVNSNFITQNTYSTIQRYLMFSVVWNFNKAGTAAPQ